MGFLKNFAKNEFGVGVPEEEIRAKFENSNIPAMILSNICDRLLPAHTDDDGNFVEDGDLYKFLNLDITNNTVWIKFYTDAISVVCQTTRRVSAGLLKTELKYDEEESGYSFAASGIENLPNFKYAKVLQTCICEDLNDIFTEPYVIQEREFIGHIPENSSLIATTFNNTRIKITLIASNKQSW